MAINYQHWLLAVLLIIATITGLSFLLGQIEPVKAQSVTSGQTLQITVAQTISLTLASSTINLPSLTPGTPVSATTSLSVDTNSGPGWNLSINRDDSDTTMDLTTDATVNFPDATAWNDTGNGNATTTTNIGSNLHFRVNATGTTPTALYSSTYWGVDEASNAKYAGYPSASTKIANNSSYNSATQTVVYTIRANAPATQRSGIYNGSTTLTAVVNP